MVRIVKHSSNNSIDFEFVEFDGWDNFDTLSDILVNKMNAKVIDKIDGVYSRYWTFEKDSIQFKLMYHEDTGNCLCPITSNEQEIKFLNDLANEMLPFIS